MRKFIVMLVTMCMLGLASVVAPTPPPADAITFLFRMTNTSSRHVTVYEKFNCSGDFDYVFPGERENNSKVDVISSIWVANNTGFLMNGLLRKRKLTGGKCINIYITYAGGIIGHTY